MVALLKQIANPKAWFSRGARITLGLLLVLLFALHGFQVLKLPLVDGLEGDLYDSRVRASMPDTVNPQIVIIDIDEKSLKQEGRWPWSRARLGDLVDRLFDRYHIVALGMDVVYAESESQTGLKKLEQLVQQGGVNAKESDALMSRLKPLLDGDRKFARAMKGHKVVLGYYFKRDGDIGEEGVGGQLPPPACDLDQAITAGLRPQVKSGYGANFPLLQEAAAGGGHFIPNVDEDGIIRSVPMLVAYQGKCYASLSLSLIQQALGVKEIQIATGGDAWSRHGLKLGDEVTIPVMRDGSAWVPYRGYQYSFNYISAADVLSGRADPNMLKGTVALLGTTAPGLLDHRSTPVGKAYAGVEVHANLVAGALDGSMRKSPSALKGVEGWLLLLVGAIMALLLGRAEPMRVVWMSLLVAGLLYVLNISLWAGAYVVMPLASSLMMVLLLFVLNMSFGFLDEERTKRLYKERFGQYVSPEVIEEMIANPQVLESMEGSSRNMTVLFADIRNFTTISEGLQPKQLMRMMNEYLTPMTRLIIDKSKYQGTIDKYIGDCIMAFWGAPLPDAEHARHGVLAALEMQKLARELTIKFRDEGWPEIHIGIGLNSGDMSVGNMGSSFRRAYTVLGDSVNLAARLEGLTKEYGVGILVSEFTRNAVPDVAFRELDRVRVKGKDRAVAIYEPIGLSEEVSGEQLQRIEQTHKMLSHFRARQWDEAEAILDTLESGDAVLVRLYREDIAEFREHPPGPEWDGVRIYKTK